jgi:hypothetical protein
MPHDRKFRWPPSTALQELMTHHDEIDSLYVAVKYKSGRTGIIASGMSETSAMRVALKFLLGESEPADVAN